MESDDDRFKREWMQAEEALLSRLKGFLAGGRPATLRIDRDDAWVALCALEGRAPVEAERDVFRSRYLAIERTYAETRNPEAALDAGKIPSRGDPRARRRALLASDYRAMTGGAGPARLFVAPPWRRRIADPTDRPLAIPVEDTLRVDLPLQPPDAVRTLTGLYGYQSATACLRALQRERDETLADFKLPDPSQL